LDDDVGRLNGKRALISGAMNGMGAYAAVEWAVRRMTKSAALELTQHKIRLHAIYPRLNSICMIQGNPMEFRRDNASGAHGRANVALQQCPAEHKNKSYENIFCDGESKWK
jgi:NAD(P)-dependent dehydrogenase (short-subunit alcohol dehydrogenase family)